MWNRHKYHNWWCESWKSVFLIILQKECRQTCPLQLSHQVLVVIVESDSEYIFHRLNNSIFICSIFAWIQNSYFFHFHLFNIIFALCLDSELFFLHIHMFNIHTVFGFRIRLMLTVRSSVRAVPSLKWSQESNRSISHLLFSF